MTLFLLGFLTLFLELVLIRYLPGSIWNLGYFPNLVLLAVFLGMGLGFVFHQRLSERASARVFVGASFGLLALIAFVYVLHPQLPGFGSQAGDVGGELYFTHVSSGAAETADYAVFLVCFLAIVGVFAAVSQRTAKVFRQFPPLTAYSFDILGSCCGIVSFMLASWLTAPASLWLLALLPLFYFAADPTSRLRDLVILPLGIAVVIAAMADTRLTSSPAFQGGLDVRWSPYQKVELAAGRTRRMIFVNGIGHQEIATATNLAHSFYQAPYAARRARPELPPYRNVLVIGAGSGNDVGTALQNEAAHVDAVEIDPVIAGFGRKYNPNRPYDDPRVRLVVDDGRAFMTRSQGPYDLIIFALTDSLVRVSSVAQLRLENYLFTEESFRRAYSLLSPQGDVVLYNYYRRPWLEEKVQRMLHAATGRYPRTIYKRDGLAMFMVGRETQAEAEPVFVEQGVEAAVDDWPFPYLRARGIPTLYQGAMACVLFFVMALLAVMHRTSGMGSAAGLRTKLAFVFMGAAFLLLETKSVVQFSLLFGTTWVNSSLVFLAVLVLVLAANWTAVLVGDRGLVPASVLLIASCLITFFYPLSRLLAFESVLARFLLASFMTFLPVFFANLVFSVTFRKQAVPEHVFGWNLLGAALGGIAEYSSLALGYTALGVVVAVCYLVVILLLLPRRGDVAPSAAPV